MVVIRKQPKTVVEQPVMELPMAKIKILTAELRPEREIITKQGATLTMGADVNTLLEVVDDMLDGDHDRAKFFESFKLKKDEKNGDWMIKEGTKLGVLAQTRYGPDFFESDQVFDEKDLVGFTFTARIQPRENPQTGAITGSTLNWETIMRVPEPKKPKQARASPRTISLQKKSSRCSTH